MRRLLALMLAVAALPALAQVAVRDDYGNDIRLGAPARRIVSLSPHLTELLFAAGAGRRVVGVAEYSDYPAEARALPKVGNDTQTDLETIVQLQPDLIVAWPNAGTVKAVDRLAELRYPVFRSEPRQLEEIATTLVRLGTLAGSEATAAPAAQAFRARVNALERRYAGRPPVRVFYQVWDRPLITVNGEHIISRIIALCGGENVFGTLPGIAPQIDREAVLRANPEVIVEDGTRVSRPARETWGGFPALAANRRTQFHSIPSDLLQRHTPRILDGAERLCEALEQARSVR
jgi:iron complex transport system substrate-binding protein